VARFVDSNVIVRYLTEDDPIRTRAAQAIIEGDELILSSLVLSEVGYVLQKYGHSRADVIDVLIALLQRENIHLADAENDVVADCLAKARRAAGLSFGDALILAQMRSAGISEIYSFDKDFRDDAIVVHERPVA
jgi:predicted nucleic acid-binding protein